MSSREKWEHRPTKKERDEEQKNVFVYDVENHLKVENGYFISSAVVFFPVTKVGSKNRTKKMDKCYQRWKYMIKLIALIKQGNISMRKGQEK